MRLADFIVANMDPILGEWVQFARSSEVASTMDLESLRDHAREMLETMAKDLRSPQTGAEQIAKSRGEAAAGPEGTDTPAEVHGSGRAASGFTVEEMVSEYRALRASVLRLWTEDRGTLTGADIGDLMRFNEAIDQALAESTKRYVHDLDRSKETFLAILGHDLRSPIGAIITSSRFMLDIEELEEPHRSLTTRILRASRRMNDLVRDLLDFTRSRLGAGVPIVREPMDLALEAAHAIDEVRAAHPESVIRLEAVGDLRGQWDCARLTQVMANLLGNAVQHSPARSSITLSLRGDENAALLSVHNRGAPIPAPALAGLFSPFKRLKSGETAGESNSLGLGLYISERIVAAHGGTIAVESTEENGTIFTIRLPR
jgi:signal transduction histidine kinase